MTHVNPALIPPGVSPASPGAAPPAPASAGFHGLLAARTHGAIVFSHHALQRIERRGIEVSPQTVARLEDGVRRAADKGARNSVVFVNGTAFVVAIPNRTVITAVDPAHMREHVFTNIDSAVLA